MEPQVFIDAARYAHILAVAIGFGAAFLADYHIISRIGRPIDDDLTTTLHLCHSVIWKMVFAMWVTGLVLIQIRTSFLSAKADLQGVDGRHSDRQRPVNQQDRGAIGREKPRSQPDVATAWPETAPCGNWRSVVSKLDVGACHGVQQSAGGKWMDRVRGVYGGHLLSGCFRRRCDNVSVAPWRPDGGRTAKDFGHRHGSGTAPYASQRVIRSKSWGPDTDASKCCRQTGR